MAIKSINELTAMTTADLTANDVLVVGTQSGAKKIPAQDAFSGGGGGDVVILAASVNQSSLIETDLTAGEILALAEDGKGLIVQVDLGDNLYDYLYATTVGEVSGQGYAMIALGIDSNNMDLLKVLFTASNSTDKFVQLNAN